MSAAAAAAAGHPLACLGLVEGDFVLIRYRVAGARIWHERLILCFQLTAPFAVGILTPDGDYYVELIAMLGPVQHCLELWAAPDPVTSDLLAPCFATGDTVVMVVAVECNLVLKQLGVPFHER